MSGRLRVRPGGPVDGRLAAPASKSMTIRHVVTAALADGASLLTGPLEAADTRAVRDAVTAYGARVHDTTDGGAPAWAVHGTGGTLRTPGGPVDCRQSGTTLRIISAVAAHAPGRSVVTGDAQLRRRPVAALTSALRALGARVHDEDGHPPVTLEGGGLDGGVADVDVSRSSQYASALLLAAPLARAPVTVAAHGAAADAYIELTVDVLRGSGVAVHRHGDPGRRGGAPGARRWTVAPGVPAPRSVPVEFDASAACHLWALAMATGGAVTVTNAAVTRQPDAGLLRVFTAMGGAVHEDGQALTVTGPDALHAVDVDLSATPDQVTTVATLAAMATGDSRLRGIGVTRGHETDRPAALAAELRALGVKVTETPDSLRVHGRGAQALAGTTQGAQVVLRTHGDHRLAMAFAALAARVPGVVIDDPDCVTKTYPGFWTDLGRLGVEWERTQ